MNVHPPSPQPFAGDPVGMGADAAENRLAYRKSWEIQHMAQVFCVSVERIREAIAAVGPSSGEVCRYLYGPGPNRS